MSEKHDGEVDREELLDWWQCTNCGESGRASVSCCPECEGTQIGSETGGVDLPPCWKEDSALAAYCGVQRLWVHLDAPAFIGMADGEVKLVREEIARGREPDPEGRPATPSAVRELAEAYNDEFYGTKNAELGGADFAE